MASKPPTIEDLVQRANIPKGCLDHECSIQDLQHVAKYCMKWKQIGHQLHLDSFISDIDSDHACEEDKRIAMLTTWKEVFAYDATFRMLIEALISCGYVQSARQIVEYLADHECKSKIVKDKYEYKLKEPMKKNITLFEKKIKKIAEEEEKEESDSIDEIVERFKEFEFVEENNVKTPTVKELEDSYEELVQDFGERLDTVQISKLHRTAACLPASVRRDMRNDEEAIHSLTRANNITEFISGLTLHGNYLKPSLLEHMIDKHGSRRLQAMMIKYKRNLQDYQQTTRLKDFVGMEEGRVNPDHRRFAEKLGQRWEDQTVKDWIQFREKEHRRDSIL